MLRRTEGSEMTRTEELMALAEDCKRGWHTAEDLSNIFEVCEADLIAAANPETIKQLVELCRLQHEALKWAAEVDSAYDGEPADELTEAIAAFNRFEGGE